MKAAHWGVLSFLGVSVAFMGLAAHCVSQRFPAPVASTGIKTRTHDVYATAQEEPRPVTLQATVTRMPSADAERAEILARKLVQLVSGDEDALSRCEVELLALGEVAAGPLVQVLESQRDVAVRDRLLDTLRKVPGPIAEAGLVAEARSAHARSSRAIAIDGLAERRTTTALEALDHVARTDPELPRQPLITTALDDTATELPDEVTFTPRMHAMAALASTEDPRAAGMLSRVLREERDESLRMEAARDLGKLNMDPSVLDALATTASTDPSPYVRLAALHSLEGLLEPKLLPILMRIATHDSHAGVRLLADGLVSKLRAAN